MGYINRRQYTDIFSVRIIIIASTQQPVLFFVHRIQQVACVHESIIIIIIIIIVLSISPSRSRVTVAPSRLAAEHAAADSQNAHTRLDSCRITYVDNNNYNIRVRASTYDV